MTSYIQSIQQVSIAISSGSSNTATINSVNTANTIIIYGGATSTAGIVGRTQASVTLTNSTTVTATIGVSNSSDTTTVVCTVVEFLSSAVNVSAQYGTVTLSNGTNSNTATITSVNTSYAAIFPLGLTNGNNLQNITHAYNAPNIELTNGTTVTANRGVAGSAVHTTLYFCVIEFVSSMINSIQHRSLTVTDSNTATTDTISSVVTNNTMLTFNGMMSATTDPSNPDSCMSSYASLTNSTTVTFNRAVGTSLTRTYKYDVIEFASGVLNSAVQRGTIALNNVTSNTATISSIATSTGFANFTGYSTASTATGLDTKTSDLVLTNSTTLTAAINTATTNQAVVSYEVIEFASGAASVNSNFFGLF